MAVVVEAAVIEALGIVFQAGGRAVETIRAVDGTARRERSGATSPGGAAPRTEAFRRDLLERADGALTTAEARERLGMASDRAVLRAATAGRLLAVDDGRRKLFPACQFDGEAVLPGIAGVIAEANGASPWAVLQFLIDGDEGIGDRRPIDLLRGEADEVNLATRFAGRLGP